jgi:membrane protease YdiL (CAAX protease family)
MPLMPQVALSAVVAVLMVANVLNNRLAASAYVLTSLVTAGVLLLFLRFTHTTWGATWVAVGLGRNTLRSGLVWGLALVVVVALGYLLFAVHPATRVFLCDQRAVGAGGGSVAYQALLRVPAGTVLLEEIAFRGVMYALVRGQYGTVWATVVSSVLFGLWHILPSPQLGGANPAIGQLFGVRSPGGVLLLTVVAVVVTAAVGVVLCELRRISGSLLAPAAVHWATNGLGYLVSFLVIRVHPMS